MSAYGGPGAYVAIYLVDAQGRFHSTLRVAGTRAKYHRHLREWSRGRATETARIEAQMGREIAGTFTGTEARLHAVPLDVLDASGKWRYAGGRLALRFEGRGRGMLWKSDVEVIYSVRTAE